MVDLRFCLVLGTVDCKITGKLRLCLLIWDHFWVFLRVTRASRSVITFRRVGLVHGVNLGVILWSGLLSCHESLMCLNLILLEGHPHCL